MKLKDLFEQEKVIEDSVRLPKRTKKLSYANVTIKGSFGCDETKITSLEGAPNHVDGNFNCYMIDIKSLEGAPSYVGGNFNCSYTKITSLQNIHKQVKHIGDRFILSTTVKSHILGVMLIKGLREVVFPQGNKDQMQVASIINKHLKGDRNVHDVQQELIDAGLSDYAKL